MAKTSLPPKKAPRKKARTRPRKPPAGPTIWDWKTPEEGWKFRWALTLVVGLLLLAACWSGEIRWEKGTWKVGVKDLQGQSTMGLQWRWGEAPRKWQEP